MDNIDFDIMKAIASLKVTYPKAEGINLLVNLDPEELGAPRQLGNGGICEDSKWLGRLMPT